MDIRTSLWIALITMLLFHSTILPVSGAGDNLRLYIDDPVGDVGSSGKALYLPEIDILNVSVFTSIAEGNLENTSITVRTAGDGYGLIVLKFGDRIFFFNKTESTTIIHLQSLGNTTSIPGFSVTCMKTINGTIYYDYVIYTKAQPQPAPVVREVVIRKYPSLWNVFGVTFILSFSAVSIIGGGFILALGNRREKIQSMVPLILGMMGLGAFFYSQFVLKKDTILGILNWSEVPIVQSVVAIVSSAIGLMVAMLILLAIIIVNQRR